MVRAEPNGRRRRATTAVAGLISAVMVAGCGGSGGPSTSQVAAGPLDDVAGVVTVRADRSLQEAFDLLAGRLERRHPKVTVRLQFAGPAELTAAGADVVASTNRIRLEELQRGGSIGQAKVFAQGLLNLTVAPGNPGRVATVRDLRRPQVSVAVCAPTEPCGEAARALLDQAEVDLPSPSRVDDTEVALRELTRGDVDAGFVWESTLRGQSGRSAREQGVRAVALSADPQEEIRLAGLGGRGILVATNPSGNRSAAAAFVELLESSEGQRVLRADGYR